jgi:hypothetical protein
MSSKSSSAVATMGIEIGKNSFHVIGLDERGAVVRGLKNGGQIVARSFVNDELVLAERTHFPPKNVVE